MSEQEKCDIRSWLRLESKRAMLDGPRINVDLCRSDWQHKKSKKLQCVQCGRWHKPPRRGDSITCECGLVFW